MSLLLSILLLMPVSSDASAQSASEWQTIYERNKYKVDYGVPTYSEFYRQLGECRGWFGSGASTTCLTQCAVVSLGRYGNNMEHPEHAKPVEPQVRARLGGNVCASSSRLTSGPNWRTIYQQNKSKVDYMVPTYAMFLGQVEECRGWFGSRSSTACLTKCTVVALGRYGYNWDHPERARPVEPQVRAALRGSACGR